MTSTPVACVLALTFEVDTPRRPSAGAGKTRPPRIEAKRTPILHAPPRRSAGVAKRPAHDLDSTRLGVRSERPRDRASARVDRQRAQGSSGSGRADRRRPGHEVIAREIDVEDV